MSWFAFKGVNSEDMNVIVQSMPSDHIVENEVEYIQIPGRDGYLTINQNRKPPIDKYLTIAILPSDKSYQDNIKKWLTGSGELVLSTEPDVFYEAKVQTVKEYAHYSGTQAEITVYLIFRCQPSKYYLSGKHKVNLTTSPSILNNLGKISKPIITIHGTGSVSLSINSQLIQADIDGYSTIDSELMESYKDSTLKIFTGPFPELIEGVNEISWTGTVTKVEVIPRWNK